MTMRDDFGDELGTDQPGPADDDDLHDDLSFVDLLLAGEELTRKTVARTGRSHPWNSPSPAPREPTGVPRTRRRVRGTRGGLAGHEAGSRDTRRARGTR